MCRSGQDAAAPSAGPVIATPYVPGGALAEMVLLPERLTYPVPEDMDAVAGAALINSYVTAVLALSRRAQLRAGETVLVHAGAGARLCRNPYC